MSETIVSKFIFVLWADIKWILSVQLLLLSFFVVVRLNQTLEFLRDEKHPLFFLGDIIHVRRVGEPFLWFWFDLDKWASACPMQCSICWCTSRFKSKCCFSLWTPLMINLWHADLKTMSKRVESELYYVTFDMFVADVRRMFANARTYNSPETIYYKCATRHVFCSLMLQLSFWFSLKIILCILLQAWITFLK